MGAVDLPGTVGRGTRRLRVLGALSVLAAAVHPWR